MDVIAYSSRDDQNTLSRHADNREMTGFDQRLLEFPASDN
jgi:hypothetical protein